jgi:hypothetical protein
MDEKDDVSLEDYIEKVSIELAKIKAKQVGTRKIDYHSPRGNNG